MKRLLIIAGIGTALGATAIAGGLSVAAAHDGRDGGQHMGGGAAMQMTMDPAAMQQHMKDILGEETYGRMQDAMKTALGDAGYQEMLDRMATGCAQAGMGMTMPDTGHSGHHPAAPPATN
ncbi:MAG: hypothetical protein C0506_14235 [Anaerolinea sp.]|nr:hypothetical protein [Anaerolinea sp.]